jgi:tetratricopeptide (TPR) repeat protein
MRLLSAASKRSPVPDPHTFYFLALAQSGALQYPEAIATFKRVIELSDSVARREYGDLAIKALNQLGGVYTQTGDKEAASAFYTESLKRDPTQWDIYLTNAEIVVATSPVGAIKLLLDGLGHDPKSGVIRSAIQRDISKLKPPEFQAAVDLLESAKATLPVTEEYAQACAFAASRLLYSDPQLAERYLSRIESVPPGELRASTRNWVARLRAIDSNLHKKFDAAYGFALQAEKIVEDENVDDRKLSQVVLSDVQVAWAKELQEQDPARLRMLNETRRRIKRLVEEGNTSFYQDFMDSNHLLKDDAESKRVFSTLLHNNNDDHSAARGLMAVCGEYIFDVKCIYAAAQKALAKPSEDIGLQLDGVEAAVLNNDRKQALEWLIIVEQHTEADDMTRAIASFYRFWLSYAENDPSSRLDFQRVEAAFNVYNRARATRSPILADPAGIWSFKGAVNVLKGNKVPAATNLTENKRKVLLAIIDAFDHPEQGTTGLSQVAERM